MTDLARQACIVGIGETRYTKWGQMADRGEWSLACEAVLNAVEEWRWQWQNPCRSFVCPRRGNSSRYRHRTDL
jgi:hypothetical protein